jgi:hypothetical protein
MTTVTDEKLEQFAVSLTKVLGAIVESEREVVSMTKTLAMNVMDLYLRIDALEKKKT